MKKMIFINCAVLAAILAAFLFTTDSVNKPAFAQSAAPNAGAVSVAVVNFSEIMKRSKDVRNLQEYIATLSQLKTKIERNLETQMKQKEENLAEYKDDPNRDQDEDYKDVLKEYTQLAAEYASLKEIFEFRQKSEFLTYSRLFMNKLSSKIQNYSTGRFDIVFKVVNPEEEDLEKMGDAMQLQLDKAKDILFYDKSKVTDITKEINRLIDNDQDGKVTLGIEKAKEALQKEISEIGK